MGGRNFNIDILSIYRGDQYFEGQYFNNIYQNLEISSIDMGVQNIGHLQFDPKLKCIIPLQSGQYI